MREIIKSVIPHLSSPLYSVTILLHMVDIAYIYKFSRPIITSKIHQHLPMVAHAPKYSPLFYILHYMAWAMTIVCLRKWSRCVGKLMHKSMISGSVQDLEVLQIIDTIFVDNVATTSRKLSLHHTDWCLSYTSCKWDRHHIFRLFSVFNQATLLALTSHVLHESMIRKLVQDLGVLQIIDAIEKSQGSTRLVGGCVRDSLIGRQTTDIDLATNLTPHEVIKALHVCSIKTIPTGIKHGTVTALVLGVPYEITTLRCDVRCYGRNADVAFTNSWKEDASRRDFTFNALSCDKYGQVYDYFFGIQDLNARVVNFIGDAEKRINEDFLRILRAFRFHATICSNSTLSEEIKYLCTKYSQNLNQLSRERIRGEFFKLLSCENYLKTLKIMQQCKVLEQIIPYQVQVGEGLSLAYLTTRSPITKLSLLLRTRTHDDAEEAVEKITILLRLSNREKRHLYTLLANKLAFPLASHQQQKYLNQFGREDYLDLVIISFLEQENPCENLLATHIDHAHKFSPPVFPLSGKDLIALGYKEGKVLGDTIKALHNLWEQSAFQSTKQHLMSVAKRMLQAHQN